VQLFRDGDENAQVAQEIHTQGPYARRLLVVEEEIREVFAAVGAEGLLHAVPVGAGPGDAPEAEVAVGADEPIVIASLVKILLVLEFARQAAAGQLDPRERVRVTAADRLGGWGTAGCADDVELSLRDLAFFAMSVSDNTAADLLLARVGLDTVRLLAGELGLTGIRLVGGPRDVLESMLADVGAGSEAEFAARPTARHRFAGWAPPAGASTSPAGPSCSTRTSRGSRPDSSTAPSTRPPGCGPTRTRYGSGSAAPSWSWSATPTGTTSPTCRSSPRPPGPAWSARRRRTTCWSPSASTRRGSPW
jgi:hypothetical protein